MNKYPKIFLIIAVVVLVFLLILYSKMETIPETPKRLKIQVVSDSLHHNMTSYPHQQTIYGLHIQITGHLDGKACMCFGKKENLYSETIFLDKGDIDYSTTLDWNTTECLMKYSPVNVESGDLLVRYSFLSPKH